MNTQPQRPVSIAHLVFGLVFAGIAGLWLLGEIADLDAPGFTVWGPAVLIGAGIVGLIASFAGPRRRPAAADPAESGQAEPAQDDRSEATEHTLTLNDPNDSQEER